MDGRSHVDALLMEHRPQLVRTHRGVTVGRAYNATDGSCIVFPDGSVAVTFDYACSTAIMAGALALWHTHLSG